MNILVVGSGGREHAIALAVKKSPMCDTLVCAPGNPGMANLGKCVPVDVADPKAIADLAVAEHIDLAVIGPEIPLVAGVVDEFRRRGCALSARLRLLPRSKAPRPSVRIS